MRSQVSPTPVLGNKYSGYPILRPSQLNKMPQSLVKWLIRQFLLEGPGESWIQVSVWQCEQSEWTWKGITEWWMCCFPCRNLLYGHILVGVLHLSSLECGADAESWSPDNLAPRSSHTLVLVLGLSSLFTLKNSAKTLRQFAFQEEGQRSLFWRHPADSAVWSAHWMHQENALFSFDIISTQNKHVTCLHLRFQSVCIDTCSVFVQRAHNTCLRNPRSTLKILCTQQQEANGNINRQSAQKQFINVQSISFVLFIFGPEIVVCECPADLFVRVGELWRWSFC